MGIAMSIFSIIGTVIISFSMLPQTIVTMKTKQTAELSLGLYLIMGIATLLITFYGIGLIMVPIDLKTTKAAEAFNAIQAQQSGITEYLKSLPDRNAVISGYLIPGIAVMLGELLCSVTSFLIAWVKIRNKMQASKLGISEQEYIDQTYKNVNVNK